ncbi:hypothetical protein [Streptomyces roseolus]|uniref:hypothetical protein n=1 Tax=Streptomyces roseolus TaxID=67358 RepID=UPI0036483251
MVDAPTVLGWDGWRALDEESSARHLAEALEALVAAGTLADQPVEPLARPLSGAMDEAALWIARGGAPGRGTGARPAPGGPAGPGLTPARRAAGGGRRAAGGGS